MKEYQRMIDACKAHRIEDMIGEFPRTGHNGISTKAEEKAARLKWIWDLARVRRNEMLDDQDAYFISAMKMCKVDETERAELANYYDLALTTAKYPLDAPEKVFKSIVLFETYWGEIPAPRWCERAGTPYKRLWLAVAMLGANGNVFPFACVRMSKAFGIKSPQTVNRFLYAAQNHGLIKVVKTGASYAKLNGGKAAQYQLADAKNYSMIQHIMPDIGKRKRIASPRNDCKKQMFWEYLAEDESLKWLGLSNGGLHVPKSAPRNRASNL